MNSAEESLEPSSDIAIIGFAARVPGAENAAQFWENLSHDVESIRTFSAKELESVGVKPAHLRDPNYVRAGAPLSHLDAFDASFFGLSPREAAIMDPQQRFFMEGVWEALEHAGYAPGTFSGSTGVFAGSGPNSYLIHNLLSDSKLVEEDGIFLLRHTGNDKDVLATRISYQMNLRGPSLNVQTACSTSLVAVHLACQSLLHYGCDIAVAGAVSIEIPHALGYLYRENEIQSQDGHCRAFDAKATGTVFGSGLGVVILRRLSEAIEAGDTIHAVIKGTAINNDGNRKVGFLAPSLEGQVDVISEALAVADVEPASIDYVETHGTGTPIGDPIELAALGQVFAGRTRELKIGSVKTNIGHLDTASGMAGLLKTVMALSHHKIPSTLHFKNLNPLVDAKTTKLQVVNHLTDWEPAKGPRRAGVTSLGIGGTNAHVVLEEAPVGSSSTPSRPTQIVTLSAKSAAALDDATQSLARHLRQFPDENIGNMAYTLHLGRAEFAYRRMFVAGNHEEALQLAETPASSKVVSGKISDKYSGAFLFSGQGSHYCDMGKELYQTEPVFQKWIDTCATHARPHLGFDFRDILYPPAGTEAKAAEQMKPTWNAQPILFSIEYALAQLWMSWGVNPTKLIGHSLGEYTAACLSGVFTLEDVISLVCARGNLMRKVNEGAMLAVLKSEAEITLWIKGSLCLAGVNGAEQCVVSGPTADILALKEKLKEKGIASQRLETSHAFHSSSLDPVIGLFVDLVSKKKLRAPQIPIVSNVTGKWLTDKEATDPAYWGRHFRQTVRFFDGLNTLTADPGSFLLEIGPGDTLCALSRAKAKETHQSCLFSLPRARGKSSDLATIFSSLGTLWVNGVAVDWQAFHAHEKRRRIPLPTYSFQRKKFWMGPKHGSNWISDALGKVDGWFYRPMWKSTSLPPLVTEENPWLVLCDSSPESQKIVDELRKQKARLITVTSGEKFQSPSPDAYVINLASEGDYALLLDQLIQRRQPPRTIVDLWALTPGNNAEDRCFNSLLLLMKTLGVRLPEQAIAITAFSQRSVSVHHEQVLHPYGSLLAGPCRVGPQEFPQMRCRQVDVDSIEPRAFAQVILRESGATEPADHPATIVAYRDGARWTEAVEPFHLDTTADRLREGGTYIITGGLGSLGLAVAECLAKTYRAKLVLISRRAESQAPDLELRFEEWGQLGAEVMACAADVTDRESLTQVLKLTREKFGKIHGVIHAAGILQDGIIQLKKTPAAHSVLAPKIEGVQILEELTRADSLDFFALFSSISAFTPPAGQVDYCAANAFLNAFAQSRPAESNFIVIGWGPWAEIGMAASKSKPAPFAHPLLTRVNIDTPARTVYSGTISVESHWVLGEHRFHGGDALLPGTANLEIAVTALLKNFGQQPIVLEDVFFLAPLRVAPNTPCIVEAQLLKTSEGYQFSVESEGVVYVSGQGRPAKSSSYPPRMKIKEIQDRCTVAKLDFPQNIRQQRHFDFGPRWQSLRQLALGQGECLGTVELPKEYLAETKTFFIHPALLDIATGATMYLIPGYDQPGDLLLPFAYKRMTLYKSLPPRVYSHARLHLDTGSDLVIFDITLADEKGEIIAEIDEFTVKRLRNVADVSSLESLSTSTSPEVETTPTRSYGIPTREGLEAFQRILRSHPSDIVFVSPSNLVPVVEPKEIETTPIPVNANADDIELVLQQLWQRLLGLDLVDAKTDFFESGGHSLLAVRLFTEIRKRFHVDLGLSTLFEARTIGALAELIRKERGADPAQKNASNGNALVTIRPSNSSKTPLFLIHDVGGGVLRYEHLSRHFPEDQSIYAIESRGLGGHPTDYSVEKMARHYIVQIRERQPHGPYFVAGHSFGGLVTYEIARQLSAQKETMGLVGLIDTYQRPIVQADATPSALLPRSDKLPFFKRLVKDTRAILWGRDRIGYIMERQTFMRAWFVRTLYRSTYQMTSGLGLPMPSLFNDVKEANWIASDDYMPGPYDGTVVLFRCKSRLDTDPPDSSHVWKRLAKGGVVIKEIPGDHNSILKEPGVRILTEQILSYLKPAEAPAGVSLK
jgi:acyl transferase domain-containing protein/thioesterase domain-containing protein/acyl carrier protein